MLDNCYSIRDSSDLCSPSLVVYPEIVQANIELMISIAGDASRLRPHCKTHKMREVVEMQLASGITKQKCATIAEVEMVADAGCKDIFLAYNLVGPNIARAADLMKAYPDVKLQVTADHDRPLSELAEHMEANGLEIDVLLDLDTGLGRTGIVPGDEAFELYRKIDQLKGVRAAGLHVYDGHNRQPDFAERLRAVTVCYDMANAFRQRLLAAGMEVGSIVAGGTGSFPCYATIDDDAIELSPGTILFFDQGYCEAFADLKFQPAALLFTRVISRTSENRMTLDLGNKAVAADPSPETRVVFPGLPEAKLLSQNEEHLLVETSAAKNFQPGDSLIAIPWHICPTSALHRNVYVVSNGEVAGTWEVAARDRKLRF